MTWSMNTLNANDLLKTRKIRSEKHKEIYREFLKETHARIKRRNEIGHTNLMYTVPPITFGKPLYNVNLAIQYISAKLTEGNFKVTLLHGTTMHIDWSHVFHQKQPSSRKRVTFK